MHILAAANAQNIAQSIPLILVYLGAVGMCGFAIFKLKGSTWHKILPVFTYLLGAIITVGIPKISPKLVSLSASSSRLEVDIPLILVILTALIFTYLENKKR